MKSYILQHARKDVTVGYFFRSSLSLQQIVPEDVAQQLEIIYRPDLAESLSVIKHMGKDAPIFRTGKEEQPISEIVMEHISSLQSDCNMGLTGEWDKNDKGFEAMLERLGKLKTEVEKCNHNIFFYVRPNLPWSGNDEITRYDDPRLIRAGSFPEIIEKISSLGIYLHNEDHLAINDPLVIEVFDATTNKHLMPIVYCWQFDEDGNEPY